MISPSYFQAVHFATGALLHDCATCGRVFTSKTTLKRHSMTHLAQGTRIAIAQKTKIHISMMFFSRQLQFRIGQWWKYLDQFRKSLYAGRNWRKPFMQPMQVLPFLKSIDEIRGGGHQGAPCQLKKPFKGPRQRRGSCWEERKRKVFPL